MAKKKAKVRRRKRRVKSAQSQLQATTRRRRRKSSSRRVTLATAVEKRPKKPRLKKRPKKPRLGASLAVWHRYEMKVDAVDRENDRRLKPYLEKLKRYEATQAAKAVIAGKQPKTYQEKLYEMGML